MHLSCTVMQSLFVQKSSCHDRWKGPKFQWSEQWQLDWQHHIVHHLCCWSGAQHRFNKPRCKLTKTQTDRQNLMGPILLLWLLVQEVMNICIYPHHGWHSFIQGLYYHTHDSMTVSPCQRKSWDSGLSNDIWYAYIAQYRHVTHRWKALDLTYRVESSEGCLHLFTAEFAQILREKWDRQKDRHLEIIIGFDRIK